MQNRLQCTFAILTQMLELNKFSRYSGRFSGLLLSVRLTLPAQDLPRPPGVVACNAQHLFEHGVLHQVQGARVHGHAGQNLQGKLQDGAAHGNTPDGHHQRAHYGASRKTLPEAAPEVSPCQVAAAAPHVQPGGDALGNDGGDHGAFGAPAGNQQNIQQGVDGGVHDHVARALGAVAAGVIVQAAETVADADDDGDGAHHVEQGFNRLPARAPEDGHKDVCNTGHAEYAAQPQQEGKVHRAADAPPDFLRLPPGKEPGDPGLHHREHGGDDQRVHDAHELVGVGVITAETVIVHHQPQQEAVQHGADGVGDGGNEVYQRPAKVRPQAQRAEVHLYQHLRQEGPHGKVPEHAGE